MAGDVDQRDAGRALAAAQIVDDVGPALGLGAGDAGPQVEALLEVDVDDVVAADRRRCTPGCRRRRQSTASCGSSPGRGSSSTAMSVKWSSSRCRRRSAAPASEPWTMLVTLSVGSGGGRSSQCDMTWTVTSPRLGRLASACRLRRADFCNLPQKRALPGTGGDGGNRGFHTEQRETGTNGRDRGLCIQVRAYRARAAGPAGVSRNPLSKHVRLVPGSLHDQAAVGGISG